MKTWIRLTALILQVIPLSLFSPVLGSTVAPADAISTRIQNKELAPGLVPYAQEVVLKGNLNLTGERIDEIERQGAVVQPGCHGAELKLFRGRVLFACTNAVRLTIPDATIDIAAGSIVYVYSTGESAVLLNLHDWHQHSVVATVGQMTFNVPQQETELLPVV